MRENEIDVLVTKNSGGPLTYAKIEAARALGLEAIVISPPPQGDVIALGSLEEAMAFLA